MGRSLLSEGSELRVVRPSRSFSERHHSARVSRQIGGGATRATLETIWIVSLCPHSPMAPPQGNPLRPDPTDDRDAGSAIRIRNAAGNEDEEMRVSSISVQMPREHD
jgi:hypothetical protein